MEVDKPARKVKGKVEEDSSDEEESSDDESSEEEEAPKNKKKGKGKRCTVIWIFVSLFVTSPDESSTESSSDEEEEQVGFLGKRKKPVAMTTPAKKPRKEDTQNGDSKITQSHNHT